MKAPRFTACRLCGGRWIALLGIGIAEQHKPGCRLLNPKTGRVQPEKSRLGARGDNVGLTLRSPR